MFLTGQNISGNRPCCGTRPVVNGQRAPYFEWQTYNQIADRVTHFGSGLLDFIQQKLNDTRYKQIPIGIWSVNRVEWLLTDLACAAYGLYIVALYDTLGPDSVEYVTNHAELETIVCSADHVIDLLKMRHKLPGLKAIVSMDNLHPQSKSAILAWAAEKDVKVVEFSQLEAAGAKNPRPHQYPSPDELAGLLYTSGTTDKPKGVMLTHRNFVASISGSLVRMDNTHEDRVLSFLPLAHIFGRIQDIMILAVGGQLGYFSGNMDTLMDDVQILKPTVFAAVPRLLNRIYGKIAQATIEAPGTTGVLARKAVAAKIATLENGGGCTHPLWDRLIFNKVKMVMGGEVRTILSGSAPLSKDIMQFLRVALCCDVREGYGASETTAASTAQNKGEYHAGEIGVPFPCCELMLADVPEMNYLSTDNPPRGEICLRGPSIFKGYYKDEEKTREAIDEDGWFHTGDIGYINERGCLVINDRKKNIFKLAQGEYIAPEKIENVYAKDSLVGQIFLHGDSLQNSLVAIIVPDPEALAALIKSQFPELQSQGYKEWCRNDKVTQAVLARLTRVGKKGGLKGFELAKAIYLESDPFSIEKDLLTPTLKVKRPQAKKYYEEQIAKLYRDLAAQSDPAKAKL